MSWPSSAPSSWCPTPGRGRAGSTRILSPWTSWWWQSRAGRHLRREPPALPDRQKLPGTAVAKTRSGQSGRQAGKVTAVDLLPGEQLVAERLAAPGNHQIQRRAIQVPEGLQEISFQLEPQRVVGGQLAAGDHIGIFISLKGGGIEASPEKETTQLTLHKVLLTAVQGAPIPTAIPSPRIAARPRPPLRTTSLPAGSLILDRGRERRGRQQDRLRQRIRQRSG